MTDVNKLFFELIRVSIGTQDCLSRPPSVDEWGELFAMAKKQSLVGICFAGVQKLIANHSSLTLNLSESLRLQWMGMAAKIQQRNEVLNGRVENMHRRLLEDGFKNCIVKGQCNALYYGELAKLRQSGDIDVWVDASREQMIAYCGEGFKGEEITESHVHYNGYSDVSVELHYQLVRVANPLYNARVRGWLKVNKERQLNHTVNFCGAEVCMPALEFNAVYYMLHMYKHLMGEGLGLRQLMDYYFLLISPQVKESTRQQVVCEMERLGLRKFASGVMYIMQQVFGLDDAHLLMAADEHIGKFLSDEVMAAGNFGHQDERYRLSAKDSHLKRFLQMATWKMRFVRCFPGEALWKPLEIFYSFFELRLIRKQCKANKIQ